MQQFDEVVSGWLNGSDSFDGIENPAGPLFIQGEAATEAKLTDSSSGEINAMTISTCSYGVLNGTHCYCC